MYFLRAIKLPILPRRNPSEERINRNPREHPINADERR